MKELEIEPYSDFYQDQVVDLIIGIQHGEFGIPINLEMQPDLLKIPEFYQVYHGNFWIARKGHKVIGTISLLDIGNNKGALRKMFVAREFRGKDYGVGQALLTRLVHWARSRGITEVLLGTTEKLAAAQRFYEKNGFIQIPKNELPGEFPIMPVDVKFYRLFLSNQP